ncbi:hypothetical protein [Salipiger mucosus]|uniref:hypothetical protein n=1 Tax=Salipiger mucosus TaxID=263378 RepID=UPI0012EC58FB|nr:hypothetical protein [Salipiger mucosus]
MSAVTRKFLKTNPNYAHEDFEVEKFGDHCADERPRTQQVGFGFSGSEAKSAVVRLGTQWKKGLYRFDIAHPGSGCGVPPMDATQDTVKVVLKYSWKDWLVMCNAVPELPDLFNIGPQIRTSLVRCDTAWTIWKHIEKL